MTTELCLEGGVKSRSVGQRSLLASSLAPSSTLSWHPDLPQGAFLQVPAWLNSPAASKVWHKDRLREEGNGHVVRGSEGAPIQNRALLPPASGGLASGLPRTAAVCVLHTGTGTSLRSTCTWAPWPGPPPARGWGICCLARSCHTVTSQSPVKLPTKRECFFTVCPPEGKAFSVLSEPPAPASLG